MKPIKFKHSNKILLPGGKEYSSNIAGVDPLPVWTDGEQCVSCWKMSLVERLSALIFGRIWLALLSGETQCPAYLSASRNYFDES